MDPNPGLRPPGIMAKIPVALLRNLPPGIAKWVSIAVLVLGYGAYDKWGSADENAEPPPSQHQEPFARPNKPERRDLPRREQPSTKNKNKNFKAEKKAKKNAGKLRLLDWNLENFSGRSLSQAPDRPRSPRGRHHEGPPVRGHDLSAIRSILREQSPDLVTFQEVLEPKALAEVFRDYEWKWTRHGGRGKQYIAFGQRKDGPLSCRPLPDLEKLSAGKSVRPGLRARCSYPGRPDFEIIVVHLKAGAKGHDLRKDQWDIIFKTLKKTRTPTVVVGDLNFAGALEGQGPKDDQAERVFFSKRARSKAQLLESQLSLPCTAYWEGDDRRDGLLESSVLDGIWLRGFGEDPAPKSRVLGACQRKKCKRIPGGRGRKAAAMAGLSDHCPLVVDF